MSGNWVQRDTLFAARNDLGLVTNSARCQEYTDWQTRHQIRCAPYCVSAASMWLAQGGYVFDAHEHVWGDRFEWNVTVAREWAEAEGLYRDPYKYRAQLGDGLVLKLPNYDQHFGMAISQAAIAQPIATIEGNTSGGRVLSKIRGIHTVQGIIAFTQSGQIKTGSQPPTGGALKMDQAAAVIIPGARIQTAGPHKGRWPTVDIFQNPDGSWDFRGANGVVLTEQDVSVGGVSIHHLGRLNKPATSIQATTDKTGHWVREDGALADAAHQGAIVATASDLGTFTCHVAKVNYG